MDHNSTKPSRMRMHRGGTILIESISGMLVGILLAIGGGWIGRWLGQGSPTGWGDLIGALIGAYGGYLFGVPLGVNGSARILGQHGSWWRALGGSLLSGIVIVLLAEPVGLNRSSTVLMLTFGLVVAIGTVVAYHSHRSLDTTQPQDGLHR